MKKKKKRRKSMIKNQFFIRRNCMTGRRVQLKKKKNLNCLQFVCP